MLRGNYTARIDAKGRLKVPTPFRRLIEEKHGSEFYITSLSGDNVRIYPLPEWESIDIAPPWNDEQVHERDLFAGIGDGQ